ncbi:DUF6789 family protein [Elizabethkingia miricola]|uniref:DUF4149 domain-containing protein n=2 Tax=Elizabethkingia TaxID=308865 RepID=A0ABD5B8K3_ELIMR|nr:DUF6789 family protein [Elizabethkingia miricola]MBS1740475.1 hypothetical protein [Bacteroidota bacterium]MDQ8750055.1 hypothetical protein [Elizabethkingia miricola]MDV3664399.1 hypothetical protein [Elizabethkingia anophelis]
MKKITIAVLAGIIGTVVMTVVMMVGSMMGMPKMSPPNMLSEMLGIPVAMGWMMHFMIGIVFAFSYVFLFDRLLKISNRYLKGAVFGMLVFVFAQIVMAIMPTPKMEGSMVLIAIGSIMGHIIFGIAVTLTAGNAYCSKKCCQTNKYSIQRHE